MTLAPPRRPGSRVARPWRARGDGAQGPPAAVPPRAGRPRDPRVDQAIKRAARELLVEAGYGGVTLDAVARRARVGRPTLYRRWRSKAELVHDAVFGDAAEHPVPDTGSLESDLRTAVKTLVAMYRRPEVAAGWHGLIDDVMRSPGLRESIRPRVYAPSVLAFRKLIARAAARGEATAAIDPDILMDIISGAVMFRLSVSGLDVGRLEDQLVTLIITALRAERAGGRSGRSGQLSQARRRRCRRSRW